MTRKPLIYLTFCFLRGKISQNWRPPDLFNNLRVIMTNNHCPICNALASIEIVKPGNNNPHDLRVNCDHCRAFYVDQRSSDLVREMNFSYREELSKFSQGLSRGQLMSIIYRTEKSEIEYSAVFSD